MVFSVVIFLLAILALSFLIFIHELGHYFMAKWVGMRIETFSIGFGKPIVSWEKNGEKWQIGWLLFGGYVKIAGMDVEGDRDPYQVPDGFFGKKPWDRIKVSLMGPLVNLIFALLIFSLLWLEGGRDKSFAEYTNKIGWVDPQSELFAKGVRPGDDIIAYNDEPYQSAKDNLYAPLTSGGEIAVKGQKEDYASGTKTLFDYKVKTYPNPNYLDKSIVTAGILQPAQYLIYNRLPSGKENPLPENSPLIGSGIQYGDRLIWADGEILFSTEQLHHILNDGKALITVMRDGNTLLFRVPRVPVQELKLDPAYKEELVDWQFEAELNGEKIQKLMVIPYSLTPDAVVDGELKFIDKDNQENAFPKNPISPLHRTLQKGDRILAVDGTPIRHSYQLLADLQHHKVNLIVERNEKAIRKTPWVEANAEFDRQIAWKALQKIAQNIGTPDQVTTASDYILLKPISPKTQTEIFKTNDNTESPEIVELKKKIASIEDPEKRTQALRLLEKQQKQLMLGITLQDRHVVYNPVPTEQFANVFEEIWRVLKALFTGSLNPKFLSGPVGIVQAVHDNWLISGREVMYLLGVISLNLGVLNLLPIPMLDGGTIMMTLFEMVTRKRIPPKTMEKLIIPFAVLLIAMFIFWTYNDILRIFSGFFGVR